MPQQLSQDVAPALKEPKEKGPVLKVLYVKIQYL